MNPFFDKLRSAREKRGLSLNDVAAATKIRQSILKNLEEGDTAKLPATYVRAFLRSYAKEVGLEESEILREYEEISRPPVPAAPTVNTRRGLSARRLSEHHVPLIAAGVLVVSLAISISLVDNAGNSREASETPFADVVKQRDPAADHPPTDSSGVQGKPGMLVESDPLNSLAPVVPPPPLVLRAMTFDSVWIRVLIDGGVPREYRVPPRWSGQWKATDNFVVSLSNADAITFTLNNRSLGMIGSPGRPVRNFVIRRTTLSIQ